MIPGSLGEGEVSLRDLSRGVGGVRRRFRKAIRRYFWLWIAYQTVKGTATLTLVWLPLWWATRG